MEKWNLLSFLQNVMLCLVSQAFYIFWYFLKMTKPAKAYSTQY